jgi:hypothetical protein
VARRGGGLRLGEGEDGGAFSCSRGKRQAAGDRQVRMGGIGIADDGGNRA